MRKSTNILIPTALITIYYLFWIGLTTYLLSRFPGLRDVFPVGDLSEIRESGDVFEPVYSGAEDILLSSDGPVRLAFASLGAGILIVPVSWVYFITSRDKEVDQSFVQTIVILPIVVTGIAMIVVYSLALAFALAGIVAAVRFRFSLDQPSHAMYIFAAIAIGLGSGIGALGISTVISAAFVYANLAIWKLQYGKTLSGPFFSMLTRRNRTEDEFD